APTMTMTGCVVGETRTMLTTTARPAGWRHERTMRTTGPAAGPLATRTITARGAATTGCAAAKTTSRDRDAGCAATRMSDVLIRPGGGVSPLSASRQSKRTLLRGLTPPARPIQILKGAHPRSPVHFNFRLLNRRAQSVIATSVGRRSMLEAPKKPTTPLV